MASTAENRKMYNSWKRIATGEHDLDTAAKIACDKYNDIRFKIRSGLPPDSRIFRVVADLAKNELLEELDAGYGKRVYYDYIQAINNEIYSEPSDLFF